MIVGFAEAEFRVTEEDQTATGNMYVELITHITTQPLDATIGNEETALDVYINCSQLQETF